MILSCLDSLHQVCYWIEKDLVNFFFSFVLVLSLVGLIVGDNFGIGLTCREKKKEEKF